MFLSRFRIWDEVLSWEDGVALFDFSVVLDYVGDCLFSEVNLVEQDVLVIRLLSCNMNSEEVLGIAGVSDVVVFGDELLKLVGKDLASKEKDIIDIDGNDKGVCNPSNLSVEDERVRIGLSTFETKILHGSTKVFVPLTTSLF